MGLFVFDADASEIISGRCLIDAEAEFAHTSVDVVEYVGLQPFVGSPGCDAGEEVELKGKTLWSWLELAYHQYYGRVRMLLDHLGM